MDAITSLLTALNGMTPLAVIALLGLIIFFQVKNQKAVRSVSDNHLSGLPEMQQDIKTLIVAVQALSVAVGNVSEKISYLAGRINGKGHGN